MRYDDCGEDGGGCSRLCTRSASSRSCLSISRMRDTTSRTTGGDDGTAPGRGGGPHTRGMATRQWCDEARECAASMSQ